MARIPNSVLRVLRPMNYFRFLLWRVKILQISFHSRNLNRRIYRSGQKGLFLDCGSNLGQGFEFFRKYYPNNNYDYVLFEPNPYCFQELSKKYAGLSDSGVQLRNLAVGINNGSIDFYGLEEEKGGIYSVGGTVLPEHNSKKYGTSSSVSLKVQSINFSEFLVDILKKYVYTAVILKLDIGLMYLAFMGSATVAKKRLSSNGPAGKSLIRELVAKPLSNCHSNRRVGISP